MLKIRQNNPTLFKPRFHADAILAFFLTCVVRSLESLFRLAPYQEIFVLRRVVTVPSYMLLSKNEQFWLLTARLLVICPKLLSRDQLELLTYFPIELFGSRTYSTNNPYYAKMRKLIRTIGFD